MASAFGQQWAKQVRAMALAEVQHKATERLPKLVDNFIDRCLATQAVKGSSGLVTELCQLLRLRATVSVNTICATAAKRRVLAGDISDNRPCMWCGDACTMHHATMILCNHCNVCYHP